jgi:NADH:ubiquinone oxidoreductase subunit F (NADH-binding)/NAD-dependent dihydropyrimidine dehydrogenase PreA subunit/(2Fe-2S) ferredoxin
MVKIEEIPLDRLTSQDDLLRLAESLQTADVDKTAIQILVGMSTCGRASGAEETYAIIKYELEKRGIDKTTVELVQTGCVGLCHAEPIVEVQYPGRRRITFDKVGTARGRRIVEEVVKNIDGKEVYSQGMGMGIYTDQTRVALRHCGVIDPKLLRSYIAVGGYQQLAKCLFERTPEEIIQVITDSGLRGRGGGGFSTGLKWGFARKAEGAPKYMVCNADEGDPGAFMDRSILEGDPHSVIETMTIAGYAIGSSIGYIYARAEYPLAVEHLRKAITQARKVGLLGKNILDSDFSFDIHIRYGAGAFVCGEETALIHSIEGRRGEPTNKPPFPAESGLWGRPTNVNNVETLASIIPILENGSDWFKSIGTEGNSGTKVFALAGDVKNVGLVEVPMGATIRDVLYGLGGGSSSGKSIKAIQTGGPSGGCIPASEFDTEISYENFVKLGSMMGSGGMIVMDEDTNMVELAKFYLEFTVEESCGKCTPCRLGTKRLLDILNKLLAGKGTAEDITTLEETGETIKASSLCGLGQTAPNPILSTLRWFREEYEALIQDAGAAVCYEIDAEACVGCRACAKACPVDCIDGKVKEAHVIRQGECIQCGACEKTCKFDAVIKRTV